MPSTPFASPQAIPRTFSYLDVGRGRPALFIHGLAINSLLWRHVICDVASFPTSRAISGAVSRWIYPDMGTPPRADVSLTGLARRVIELCDHLSVRRFDLVANNTGGAVAQIVAAHLSQRLSTLTLTNGDTEGNTPPMLFKPFAIAARLGLFAKVGPRIAASRGLMLRGLTAGYRHPGRLPAEVVDTYLRPVFGTPESSRAIARISASISNADVAAVRRQLAQPTVSTLIVWGTRDVFFALKWAQRLSELLPGTTKVATLDSARMHFPDERAAEFLPLVCAMASAKRSNAEKEKPMSDPVRLPDPEIGQWMARTDHP